jgi:hypothetical protein
MVNLLTETYNAMNKKEIVTMSLCRQIHIYCICNLLLINNSFNQHIT